MKQTQWSSAKAVLLATLALSCLGGCERDPEYVRALLSARAEEWSGRISALSKRHARLKSELAQVPTPAGDSPNLRARRQRAEAVLMSDAQVVNDIEATIRQARMDVEAALRDGSGPALERLDLLTNRISAALAREEEQFSATERDIAQLGSEISRARVARDSEPKRPKL